jgi:hypothetical protein
MADSPDLANDAVIHAAHRLILIFRALGHEVHYRCDCPFNWRMITIAIDPEMIDDGEHEPYLDIACQDLGLRVVAKPDTSGRVVLVEVRWRRGESEVCWWDEIGDFNFDRLAREILENVY